MSRKSRAADLEKNKENLLNGAAHSKVGCLWTALREVGKSMASGGSHLGQVLALLLNHCVTLAVS